MDPQVQVVDGGVPDAVAGEDGIVTAPIVAPNTNQPAQAAQSSQGKVVQLPTNALARIKQEAKEKGRKDALSEYARAQGFESVEKMQAALLKATQQPAPTRQPKPQPQARQQVQNIRPDIQNDRAYQKLVKERDDLAKRMRTEASARKRLQRELDAKEVEMALREEAVKQGVKDVDYALRLFTRSNEGKTEAELAALNEAEFFAGLKQTHPYLYGEVSRPATTGTGATGGTNPPKPGEVAQLGASGNQVDVSKMSKQEFNQYMRTRGYNPVI